MDLKPPFPAANEDANSNATYFEVEIKQEVEIDIGPTSLQPPDVHYTVKTELTEETEDSESTLYRDASLEICNEDDNVLQNVNNQRQIASRKSREVDPQPKIKKPESETPPEHNVYYECAECGHTTTYSDSSDVRIHTGLKPHECVHSREKLYECSVCSVKFGQSGHLKDHVKIHTGEKPYECSLCSVKFTTNAHLKRHMRIHTAEKPYECSMCSVKFRQSGHLKDHMKIHTGEKPYKCSVCSVKFTTNGQLNRHMRIHPVRNQ